MVTARLDSSEFRRVLGHYPTGVCAITAIGASGPVGMIVGSFTSVSLDPPLVGFLPDRASRTWTKIEETGRFCVNMLAEQQRHVCATLSSKLDNKFDSVPYRLSQSELPLIEGVVAWIDCDLYAVHEAGDHYIALGLVRALGVERAYAPLLFHRGGYSTVAPSALEV